MNASDPPRSVDALAVVPPALHTYLNRYLVNLPDSRKYSAEYDGLLRYFVEIVGPLGRLINKAFPSRAAFPTDILSATRDFIIPHVGNLLRYLVRFTRSARPCLNLKSRFRRASRT